MHGFTHLNQVYLADMQVCRLTVSRTSACVFTKTEAKPSSLHLADVSNSVLANNLTLRNRHYEIRLQKNQKLFLVALLCTDV